MLSSAATDCGLQNSSPSAPLECAFGPGYTPESIMSKEECSYNESLCCSAIASVHHTDKRLSMDYLRLFETDLNRFTRRLPAFLPRGLLLPFFFVLVICSEILIILDGKKKT